MGGASRPSSSRGAEAGRSALAPFSIAEDGLAQADGVRALLCAAFPTPAEADLVERLRRDGDAAVALVAAAGDGRVIGHVMLSRMAAPFRALGLGPVAVDAAHRRRGTGAALIGAALARARAGGWQGVFVLGDPAYYRRFGFTPEAAAGFDCAYAGPYLMALALGGGPLPVASGPVAYAPAFAALEA
ncbi:MAG: N-acetyltransferase [Alphaproteobacteria bacterium]|nr:N-acetyltransferase [Alphaproteobacteria bacterium]